MSREYYNVTLEDLNFYKMYQRWYYCLDNSVNYLAEQDLDVGDLVKYNGELAIVSGLSGLHRNLYIMRWENRSNRYWCCGVRQSELLVVDKFDYINTPEYKNLYIAYVDWLRKNNFQICSAHFREQWNKYKAGETTKIESACLAWELSKTGNNSILESTKNFVSRIAKKKEVIL